MNTSDRLIFYFFRYKGGEPMTSPKLILASASPRRADLLKKGGIDFEVNIPFLSETRKKGELAKKFVMRMGFEKALSVQKNLFLQNRGSQRSTDPVYILGADTIVVLGDKIYGKPANQDESRQFLKELSGHTHEVLTGYAILQNPDKIISRGVCRSGVTMRRLSSTDIENYLKTGEPADKAGAYAAQGIGGKFIAKIEGSETNVIGLPMEELIPWFVKLHLLKGP